MDESWLGDSWVPRTEPWTRRETSDCPKGLCCSQGADLATLHPTRGLSFLIHKTGLTLHQGICEDQKGQFISKIHFDNYGAVAGALVTS